MDIQIILALLAALFAGHSLQDDDSPAPAPSPTPDPGPQPAAGEWTPVTPSVIRDAIHGRLGYQDEFGTTYVSGATSTLTVKQNPIDGSANEGDALLYAGTTNGGLYLRRYDYQSDTWESSWHWVSQPSNSATGTWDGSQAIGSVALSPDGQWLAVGRGNPSNYDAYAPNSPVLQIGRILDDGSLAWQATPLPNWRSGEGASGNVRSLHWQDDGLYVTTYDAFTQQGQLRQLTVDDEGHASLVGGRAFNGPVAADASAPEAPLAVSTSEGQIVFYTNGVAQTLSDATDWTAIVQARLNNGEKVARVDTALIPDGSGDLAVLVGWYGDGAITHVDKLHVNAQGALLEVASLDFTGHAGSGQATNAVNYGNYSLAFDPTDPSLNSVLVGGNQYSSAHPDDATPYLALGGFIRGHFDTQVISAVFGPFQDAQGQLVPDSLTTGHPHADSRVLTTLMTPEGLEIIQGDDGGVWRLSADPTNSAAQSWDSLNAPGLNSLEVMSTSWDARSNSLAAGYQDNSVAIGQWGDAYLSNVWVGDGQLGLVDGAHIDNTEELSWVYLASQRYMSSGPVYALGLDADGRVQQSAELQLSTSFGTSVVPVKLMENLALLLAGTETGAFKLSAEVNPYRPGDLVLAGESSLYEAFIAPGESRDASYQHSTLNMVPVLPLTDANTYATAVDIGSSDAVVAALDSGKPFFWDSLLAATWNSDEQSSTIWFRDALSLEQAPTNLASVDPSFLAQIGLQSLSTSNYVISDIAHTVDNTGQLDTAYWLEASINFVSSKFARAVGAALHPTDRSAGAALVIHHDGVTTRLPYATTPGLDGLVLGGDFRGPTQLAIMPGLNGDPDLLVVGGEHGLWSSELDATGLPVAFAPMSTQGLDAGVQSGRAVSSLNYNAQDDVLVAGLLGGGTMIYSRSGDIGPTPGAPEHVLVSQTAVTQALSQTLDKRGNAVEGSFAISLPEHAFNAEGVAEVEVVLRDAALWREHLDALTFLDLARSASAEFNLLRQDGDQIVTTLSFHDHAELRFGFFTTQSTAQHLPTISLPFDVTLLDAQGTAVETVSSQIQLVPDGQTPSFIRYNTADAPDVDVFQAQFRFGDGIDFATLPFQFKVALPGALPEGAELYAFEVADPLSGAIVTADGTRYLPTDTGYLAQVQDHRLDPEVALTTGASSSHGMDIAALNALFFDGDARAYLASEGAAYGQVLTVDMPQTFGRDSDLYPPFIGVALQLPDGDTITSTLGATSLQGNEINLAPDTWSSGVVIDVGHGGIFAAQDDAADIQVARSHEGALSGGFVRLDDLFGHIGDLAPGDAGYVQAALQRSLDEGLNFTLGQAQGEVQTHALEGFIEGTFYASFITPNFDSVAQAMAALKEGNNDAPALFSFDAANPVADGGDEPASAAIPFATDMIAFEATPSSGVMDYNDVVMYYGAVV
jgi:hypothetical protein